MVRNLAALLLLITSLTAAAKEWNQIEAETVRSLLHQDLQKMVQHISAAPAPEDREEIVRRFSLYLRAGYIADLDSLIDALRPDRPTLSLHDAQQMASLLTDRKLWRSCRKILEKYPEALYEDRGGLLLRNWMELYSPEDLEAFLRRQAEIAPTLWLPMWFHFCKKAGSTDQLLQLWKSRIQSDPENFEFALACLEAVEPEDASRLTWVVDEVELDDAFESYELGRKFAKVPNVAMALFERSLSTPFTLRDHGLVEHALLRFSASPMVPDKERLLRLWTKMELVKVYHEMGLSEKAQPLAEELHQEEQVGAYRDVINRLNGFTQQMSGKRVIEADLLAKEKANESSPQYWEDRAHYYIGRKEYDEALSALNKALELCPVAETSAQSRRIRILYTITGLFRHQKSDPAAAIHLLDVELDRAPLGSQFAASVVHMRCSFNPDAPLKASDERLWKFLEAQVEWDEMVHGKLLILMLGKEEEPRRKYLYRAAQIARKVPLTRSPTMAKTSIELEEHALAVDLLKPIVDQYSDRHRFITLSLLWEAYLGLGDFKSAEGLLPGIIEWQTKEWNSDCDFVRYYKSQLAVTAAKQGDRRAALRLWKQTMNIDRLHLEPLNDLVRYGMRNELIKVYEALARDEKRTSAPEMALAHMKKDAK